jgi:hypothetical protein
LEPYVAVTVFVMAGLLLSVIAWQLLAVARDHTRNGTAQELDAVVDNLTRRVQTLEQQSRNEP